MSNTNRVIKPPASVWPAVRQFIFRPEALLIPLTVLLALVALSSLRWRMELDPPANLYMARLIDRHGWVPYRDFWDNNIPGTYFMYVFVGRMIGYTNDFAFQVFDLVYLSAISAVTWLWLRKLGRNVAWAAVVLFGLVYLGSSSVILMQKDYLNLLPLASAALIGTSFPRLNSFVRAFLVGVLFGITITVKPHTAIGLPLFLLFQFYELRQSAGLSRFPMSRLLLLMVVAGVGFVIPAALLAVYLIANSALDDFLEMASNYWPLYSQLTRTLVIVHGAERARYVTNMYFAFGGHSLWFLPACVGALAAFFPSALATPQRRQVILMLALAAGYSLYPFASGQFFDQHWIFFLYFLTAVCALCFIPQPASTRGPARWLPVVAVILSLALRPDFLPGHIERIASWLEGRTVPLVRGGKVDEIAEFLRENLRPGKRVHALDSLDAVIHAMLIADALPANRHIYGVQFYHDISTPYVQGLRQELIGDLRAAPPRFMIEVIGYPFVTGPDTSAEFMELRLLLASRYSRVPDTPGTYTIYDYTGLHGEVDQLLVVYPLTGAEVADWFEEASAINLLAVPGDSALVEETFDAIGEAAADHDFMTLVYLYEDYVPGSELEQWANSEFFRFAERRAQRARAVDYLIPRPECEQTRPEDAVFGGEWALHAAGAASVQIGENRLVCARLDWTFEATASAGYRMAADVVNARGEVVARFDDMPGRGFSPTAVWTPDQPVTDRIALRLPDDLEAGEYEVRLSLYNPVSGETAPVSRGRSYVLIGRFAIPADE